MRRVSLLLLVIELFLLFPVVCRWQDASKIINQYVKAAGGSKALSKVRTVLIDGTVQAQAGNDSKSGTYSFRVKLPNRSSLPATFGTDA